MSSNGWYSKQDVMKDLSEVTGKCLDDFDEHYVIGENPPPTGKNDEDDQELLKFYGGQKPMLSDNIEKPDLVGITKMLRMVDNYYETPKSLSTSNEEHRKSRTTNKEPTNIVVSISKLNPNVTEFVPTKSIDSKDFENKVSKKELKITKDVSLSNLVGAKETVKTHCCDTVKTNISDTKIDISQLLSSELKEMREQLKTKICDTSKVKCVKLRRERNLAIATLLKLYCKQPATEENKPNLICPDYFKNNPASKNEQPIESKNNSDDIFAEHNLNASSEAEVIKKEIEASVEKVTRWLHNSEPNKTSIQNNKDVKELLSNVTEIAMTVKKTIKGPTIHLGPVTFKRKTNHIQPVSPVSLQSDNSKAKSESFVPSLYASELTKKYIQQSNKKKEAQADIWNNLEAQLKEKDEAIKKQRLQTLSSISSTCDM